MRQETAMGVLPRLKGLYAPMVGQNALFFLKKCKICNKASQAIQSTRTVLLLISLLAGYSFANVHVKGIVAFKQ